MRLPDSFLQELKDRNNILDVVSGYVNLKRSGRTMSGLCPFHGEKTPSFHVNAEQGYFTALAAAPEETLLPLSGKLRIWIT